MHKAISDYSLDRYNLTHNGFEQLVKHAWRGRGWAREEVVRFLRFRTFRLDAEQIANAIVSDPNLVELTELYRRRHPAWLR